MQNNAPWVTTELAPASGLAWRCTRIEHLPEGINRGRHHVFIRCYRGGEIVRDGSVSIKWGWEGQRPDEVAPPVLCDKRAPDPSCDIPIERGQRIRVWVDDGKGTPSEAVLNLHAVLDGTGGNYWHHQSYDVDFTCNLIAPPVQPPVITEPPTIPTTGTLEKRVAELEQQMRVVNQFIGAKG